MPEPTCLTFDRATGFRETLICMACGAWQEEGEEYRELVIGGESCVLCPTCYPEAAGIEALGR